MRGFSHNILTDALQVLSRSQVTLELSMSMRIRPICKSLHTYIHTKYLKFISILFHLVRYQLPDCRWQLYTISRVIAPDKSVGRWMAAQSHCCACMYLHVRTGLHQCDAVQTHCYHVPFQSRCSTGTWNKSKPHLEGQTRGFPRATLSRRVVAHSARPRTGSGSSPAELAAGRKKGAQEWNGGR
jgi:hypothetical protein